MPKGLLVGALDSLLGLGGSGTAGSVFNSEKEEQLAYRGIRSGSLSSLGPQEFPSALHGSGRARPSALG